MPGLILVAEGEVVEVSKPGSEGAQRISLFCSKTDPNLKLKVPATLVGSIPPVGTMVQVRIGAVVTIGVGEYDGKSFAREGIRLGECLSIHPVNEAPARRAA